VRGSGSTSTERSGRSSGSATGPRPLAAGIERADSIAVDAHKWLNVPNGVGFVLTRSRAASPDVRGDARRTSRPTKARTSTSSGSRRVGAGAARASGPRSRSSVARGSPTVVTRCCDLTAELASDVERSPDLELTAPAPSCVCCFRFRPGDWSQGPELDDLNRRIQAELAREGNVLLTGASLANGFSLRAAIVSWRTRRDDVAAVVRDVERIGNRLAGRSR
jgi:glutamate/tyrosine decarboxylase-like PLP-dependent enzyme